MRNNLVGLINGVVSFSRTFFFLIPNVIYFIVNDLEMKDKHTKRWKSPLYLEALEAILRDLL